MSDDDNDDKIDFGEAIYELRTATNKLREYSGSATEPVVKPEGPFCSFCGRGKNEVNAMVKAPGSKVLICNECVYLAQEIIKSNK